MPVRERCHNRELFGPWLLRQINSNMFEGVYWLDKDRKLFRLPWKHLNIRNVDEKDIAIFKAWAIQSGKYNPDCEDLPTYKTNFRCALKAVCNKDRNKMFSNLEDKSSDPHDPHKIFMFNGVHGDSSAAVDASTASQPTNEETNLQNEIEHDEDYRLRISPDVERSTPFINVQESAVIEQLVRELLLDSDENGAQQVFEIFQDDYSQDIPRVDQVFREAAPEPIFAAAEPFNNGHEQHLPNDHTQMLNEQCSQYRGNVMYYNGHCENLPANGQVFQQLPVCSQPQPPAPTYNFVDTLFETQTCHYGFQQESAQHMINNEAVMHSSDYACNTNEEICATSSPQHNTPSTFNEQVTASQETPVTLNPLANQMPKLSSWEVTVFYRGKEVVKQNVSTKFYINYTGCVPQPEAADIVVFPPTTDTLVDQLQIEYTDKILDSVGNGLLLDVSPQDWKLYATRMGKSRVYWGMSESLETRENASHSKKLDRDVATEIFDFSQFMQELKDYKDRKRSSPDFTLYLSFGQSLFEPIKKPLVLVKLVPSFCTFWHQLAQQGGASSLHNELLSLQISNGSSFNSFDMPCLMDFDLSEYSGLF